MSVINLTLLCPKCGGQHIDKPEPAQPGKPAWDNPPHRKHLCHHCGHLWMPSLEHTNGVADVGQTFGGLYDLKGIACLLREIEPEAYANYGLANDSTLVKAWLATMMASLELTGLARFQSEAGHKRLGNAFISLIALCDLLGLFDSDSETQAGKLPQILNEAIERFRLRTNLAKAGRETMKLPENKQPEEAAQAENNPVCTLSPPTCVNLFECTTQGRCVGGEANNNAASPESNESQP